MIDHIILMSVVSKNNKPIIETIFVHKNKYCVKKTLTKKLKNIDKTN